MTRKHSPGRKATPVSERLPREDGPPAGTPPHRVAELESVLCLIAEHTHDVAPWSYADLADLVRRIHELAAAPVGWMP